MGECHDVLLWCEDCKEQYYMLHILVQCYQAIMECSSMETWMMYFNIWMKNTKAEVYLKAYQRNIKTNKKAF